MPPALSVPQFWGTESRRRESLSFGITPVKERAVAIESPINGSELSALEMDLWNCNPFPQVFDETVIPFTAYMDATNLPTANSLLQNWGRRREPGTRSRKNSRPFLYSLSPTPAMDRRGHVFTGVLSHEGAV